MAQLSKEVIKGIAEKLTEKSKKYVDSVEKELKELVTEIYEEQVPAEVMKVFKSHPDYVETCQILWMDGHGLNRFQLTMTKRLPATTGYNQSLKLTAVIADKIIKVKRKKEKAEEDYKTLLNETLSALFALKTHKNIAESLPEAKPFLPPPMSNSLVVNFDSLKKRLNK